MNSRWIYALLLCLLSALCLSANPILGTAGSYSVLAGSAVTNTGATVLSGDLGVSPGTSITGFPSGVVVGATHQTDAAASQAQLDALAAYNALKGYAATQDLTGMDLGGLTLTPGVYKFNTSAQLSGTLTLDMLGDPNSLFIFQVTSLLMTASNAAVITSNGQNCCNVFWQVGNSATLGTDTDFRGSIIALTSITLDTGTDIVGGRALALNGAVTLGNNRISDVGFDIVAAAEAPEPGSLLLLGAGLFGLVWLGRKSRRRAT